MKFQNSYKKINMEQEMQQRRLILVRHGESLYNQQNLFTGWSDIDLTQQGEQEAREVGILLKKHDIYPDICFTSWLKRAIHTAQIALKELDWEHIDLLHSYKLNERHYGAWQGKNKEQIREEVGTENFLAVRRGYDVRPPSLLENDTRVAWREKKYSDIAHDLLPLGESLQDTKKRVLAYYEAYIKKSCKIPAQFSFVLMETHYVRL